MSIRGAILCALNRHDWFNADGDPDVDWKTRDACRRCNEPRFTPECWEVTPSTGQYPCTRNSNHTPPHRAFIHEHTYSALERRYVPSAQREVTW
jgi:hypothetical protein